MALEVIADLYDMWLVRRCDIGNFSLVPTDRRIEGQEDITKTDTSRKTGQIRVKTIDHDPDAAFEEASRIIGDLLSLATFTEGRRVFVFGERCLQTSGTKQVLLETRYNPTYIGPTLPPNRIVYPPHIVEFLRKTYPQLTHPDFRNSTGMPLALAFLNEGMMVRPFEISHMALCSSLEVLANNSSASERLLSRTEWRKTRRMVEDFLTQKLGLEDNMAHRVVCNFGSANKPSLAEKGSHLLEITGLQAYTEELSQAIRMRNDIAHGRGTQKTYLGVSAMNVWRMLSALLARIIVCLFGFTREERIFTPLITSRSLMQ